MLRGAANKRGTVFSLLPELFDLLQISWLILYHFVAMPGHLIMREPIGQRLGI